MWSVASRAAGYRSPNTLARWCKDKQVAFYLLSVRNAHRNSSDHDGRSGGRVAPVPAYHTVPDPPDILWCAGLCLTLHRHRASEGLEVLLPWIPEARVLRLRAHLHGPGEWRGGGVLSCSIVL